MGTKSRETIYGGSVRAAAERAMEARKAADRLACEAWNKRMLGFQGPAQPHLTAHDVSEIDAEARAVLTEMSGRKINIIVGGGYGEGQKAKEFRSFISTSSNLVG
jgi:hypothetical protein